jgi:anti-sigma-K factor RskA
VLAAARGETTAPASIAQSKPKPKPARIPEWMPWAIAAGIAVAAVVQFAGREQFRADAERLRAEADANRRDADTLRARNAVLEAQAGSLTAQSAQLQQKLDDFKKRDALAEVRIATLSAQVNALTKASAVIVWDADQQRGILKLANLPKADSGKDYQLWVIDPKYNSPVSAGVITVGAGGTAYVSFSPTKPISAANKFAISLERAGGSPTPTQVVFIGD